MSVCGQTEEESASEEAGPASREAYEQKAVSKVVRVLTVLAYLLSVSLAAILLSVYYVCVWKSPELPLLNGTGDGEPAARRELPLLNGTGDGESAARRELPPLNHSNDTLYLTGRGGVPVNDSLTQSTTANITDVSATSSALQPSSEAGEEYSGSPYSTLNDIQSTDAIRTDNSSVT